MADNDLTAKNALLRRLPDQYCASLLQFLLDGRTGNVQLNIRDGRILGFSLEDKVSVKG